MKARKTAFLDRATAQASALAAEAAAAGCT
jgi:hypothetical protein